MTAYICPTEKQATTWLAALDNLINRCEFYRAAGDYADLQYEWEKKAIFRLRGLLIAAGAATDRKVPV